MLLTWPSHLIASSIVCAYLALLVIPLYPIINIVSKPYIIAVSILDLLLLWAMPGFYAILIKIQYPEILFITSALF